MSVFAVPLTIGGKGSCPLYSQPRKRPARVGNVPSASYAAQSTCAPTPDARARMNAARAPSAAVCPTMHNATIPGSFTGTSSEWPWGSVCDDITCATRSVHL